MENKLSNDRLNYILLFYKSLKYKLRCKENREFKRLKKLGFDKPIHLQSRYMDILYGQNQLKLTSTKTGNHTEERAVITDYGLKAIKHNLYPSETKKRVNQKYVSWIQNGAIIISVIASIIAIILSIKSYDKKTEIDKLEDRIDKIEQQSNY